MSVPDCGHLLDRRHPSLVDLPAVWAAAAGAAGGTERQFKTARIDILYTIVKIYGGYNLPPMGGK
ncbi:MAG TPA: hypothetical protein VJ890_02310 [Vineibacter sp.]|nr:hypothetical protein [Vineibacter sp.]